jgi:hypothetical protein
MHQPVEACSVTQFPRSFAIETLWRPAYPLVHGLPFGDRYFLSDWYRDVVLAGVMPGNVIEFLTESVLEYFQLTVKEDGSERTDPIVVRVPNGATASANGYFAHSIGELAAIIHSEHAGCPWMFPMQYRGRVGIISRVPMRVTAGPDGPSFKCERKSS